MLVFSTRLIKCFSFHKYSRFVLWKIIYAIRLHNKIVPMNSIKVILDILYKVRIKKILDMYASIWAKLSSKYHYTNKIKIDLFSKMCLVYKNKHFVNKKDKQQGMSSRVRAPNYHNTSSEESESKKSQMIG